MIDKSVVKELDLSKYLGTWYEIARYDHSFERGLVGVTANYSIRPDGKIKVVNSGYKNSLDGEYKEAIGPIRNMNRQNSRSLFSGSFMPIITFWNWIKITSGR